MEEITEQSSGQRAAAIQSYGAVAFAVSIAGIGAIMMTITSSPQMKGAAFLWIPAALQLMAGVWFGPVRGLLAGGIGAYGAGIIAYGGWGLVDIVMNPIAGGLANSMIPAILFSFFKINPDFDADDVSMRKAIYRTLILFIIVLVLGASPLFVSGLGWYAHLLSIGILVLGFPLILYQLRLAKTKFVIAVIICIVISALSALIGSAGIVMSGQSWEGALLGTGLGWFLGDTVSCFLGLYLLVYFTKHARERGLVRA